VATLSNERRNVQGDESGELGLGDSGWTVGLRSLALQHPAIIAFLVAVVLYLPVLAFPFVDWDDYMYVSRNPRIADSSLSGLFHLWDPEPALLGKFIEYFPLRDTVWWLAWAVVGANAAVFHALNVIAHGVASALIVDLGRRLSLGPAQALAAGLFFAVHPAHVESVTWVSGLKDPLYSCFFLFSLRFFMAAITANSGGRPRPLLLASLLALIAALLCKSLAIALPGVLLAYSLSLGSEDRASSKGRLVRVLGVLSHVAVVGLFLLVFIAVGQANDVMRPAREGSVVVSLLTGGWALVRYLQLAVAPVGLGAFHAIQPYVGAITDVRAVAGLVVVAVFAVAGIVAVRRGSVLWATAIALFLFPLVPVLHLVPIAIDLADRFLYLPLAGAALVFGRYAGSRLFVVVLVAVGLSVTTLLVQRPWSSDLSLWQDAVASDGAGRPVPWMLLGSAHQARGEFDEAAIAYDEGMRRNPSIQGERIGRDERRIAELAFRRGDLLTAEAHARRSAAAANDPAAWGLLSYLARQRGDTLTAVIAAANACAWSDEETPRNLENHGRALLAHGDTAAGRRELERLVAIDKDACRRVARLLVPLGSRACVP